MKTQTTIDWISYTVKGSVPGSGAVPSEFMTDGLPGSGFIGYTDSYTLENSIVILSSPDRPEMGLHVQIGGAALRTLAAQGYAPTDVLKAVLRLEARVLVRRIDLAIDIQDGENTVQDFVDWANGGLLDCAARSRREIKSSDGGHTLYVGSRSSERMLRVYDKGIESGTNTDWVRCELEVKGDRADGIARFIALGGQGRTSARIYGAVKDYAHFRGLKDWEKMENGMRPEVTTEVKHERKTRQWLMDAAARSLAKLVVENDDWQALQDFMDASDRWIDYYMEKKHPGSTTEV